MLKIKKTIAILAMKYYNIFELHFMEVFYGKITEKILGCVTLHAVGF